MVLADNFRRILQPDKMFTYKKVARHIIVIPLRNSFHSESKINVCGLEFRRPNLTIVKWV